MKASREFQVLVKPTGSICNLDCHYCYYSKKKSLYARDETFRMNDDILERYIVQHIEAYPEPVIPFSWHGGEPTVLGLEYFRRIVALQRKHQLPDSGILNGMQTNGTLLDEEWCRFLAEERFAIGISLDGPQEMHDRYRPGKDGTPSFKQTMRGYRLLQRYRIPFDILCVVNASNVRHPSEVYRFFKEIEAPYITFLPMVERRQGAAGGIGPLTVPPEVWGDFLCAIFDEWVSRDIGKIKVQIFEEAARTAFEQEHSLCIFRPVCGEVPVVEHNGDFFSCDHYVDEAHRLGNIADTSLAELLESPPQRAFGKAKLETLPGYCQRCEVRSMCNGECPKNRFVQTPDGEPGLNYLCAGYKRFFTHCRPFVTEVAAQWRRQNLGLEEQTAHPRESKDPAHIRTDSKIGRNDPCPCNSGLKYKKCCLKKDSL